MGFARSLVSRLLSEMIFRVLLYSGAYYHLPKEAYVTSTAQDMLDLRKSIH